MALQYLFLYISPLLKTLKRQEQFCNNGGLLLCSCCATAVQLLFMYLWAKSVTFVAELGKVHGLIATNPKTTTKAVDMLEIDTAQEFNLSEYNSVLDMGKNRQQSSNLVSMLNFLLLSLSSLLYGCAKIQICANCMGVQRFKSVQDDSSHYRLYCHMFNMVNQGNF